MAINQTLSQYPLVSVVIVNYDGKTYLEQCLRAVFRNNYLNYETIVVDNGSSDGSVQHIEMLFGNTGRLKIIQNHENLGPAHARNQAAKLASGKYLAFLDNDTEPEPGWLVELVKTMEQDPSIGACQSKLLLMSDHRQIDYVGDYLSQFGFLVQRASGGMIDDGQFDAPDEILSAKSAAMAISRDVFNKAGGFDDDYFIYVEETDLGWRVWLGGSRVVFVAGSRVYHAFGTSAKILPGKQNYLSKFHGTKNYIATLIKNLGMLNLARIVPIHIALWVALAIWLALKGQFSDAKYIFQGIAWVMMNFGSVWRKRQRIQHMRVALDKDIMPRIMRHQNLGYFYQKATGVHRIGNAEGWYRPKWSKRG